MKNSRTRIYTDDRGLVFFSQRRKDAKKKGRQILGCCMQKKTCRLLKCLMVVLLTIQMVCLLTLAESLAFPFEEDFEGTAPGFDTAAGWGIVEAHGDWTNLNSSRHLDNNVTGADQLKHKDASDAPGAVMNLRIQIPPGS